MNINTLWFYFTSFLILNNWLISITRLVTLFLLKYFLDVWKEIKVALYFTVLLLLYILCTYYSNYNN